MSDPVKTLCIDTLTREISNEQVQDILASTIRGVAVRLNGTWRLEASETDLSLFCQQVEGKTDAFKLELKLNACVDTCFEALCSYDHRKQWDDAVAPESSSNGHNFLTAVAKNGDHVVYRIVYTRTPQNLGGIIAARDFVDMTMTRIDTSGKITYFAKSVIHPDYPEVPGIVRGYNYPCGMTFLPDGPTSCRLTYLLHPDISGWIPSSVKNSSMTGVLMTMMRNYMKFVDSKNESVAAASSSASGNKPGAQESSSSSSAESSENKDELFGLYSSVLEGSSWGDLTADFDKDKAFDLMWPEKNPQFEVDFNFLGSAKSDDESSIASQDISERSITEIGATDGSSSSATASASAFAGGSSSRSGATKTSKKRKKGSVMPVQEKRARNKKAADKYRKKKREEYEQLVADGAKMTKENTELKAKIEKLEGELSYLRDLLLTAVGSHVDPPPGVKEFVAADAANPPPAKARRVR